MLEKILDYQEKRKQKKKEMEPKKLEIYLIIFGIAIIILLLNNIFGDGNTSKSNNTSKLKAFVTAERLDKYFNKIKNNYELTAKITRNDEEINETDNIATGDILTTSAGDKYTLIVTGDLNKDGKLNLKDLVKMRKYFLDGNNLDENEILAADCKFDGKINLKDLVKMRLMLLNQDATK